MTLLSRRIVGAVALLATLALSACAVPGQGDPGVAATYGDRVVTNQQVLDMGQTYADLGTASNAVGEPLTMLLLGPDLIAEAEKLGMVVSDDELATKAQAWIDSNQKGGTVTPETLELVHDLSAVIYLLMSTDGIGVLEQAGIDAEAGIVASPRYGSFTRAQYAKTINAALNEIAASEVGPDEPLFASFRQVSGFAGVVPTWVSGG
jgi:hypothetical protein